MENNLSLEKVTALLTAADKIRTASSAHREGGVSANRGITSMIGDALQIVSDFVPEPHKRPFNNALKSCGQYCGTYCSLKRHFREMRGQTLGIEHVAKTLKVVMPMLENKHKIPITKVLNALEALQN